MKKRKELKEFRTATSKRFLNLDGTIQVELFKEPVHFLNENGLYEEINNTLEETPYGVRNKRSDFKVDFNYKNNDNFLEISLNNKKIKMFPKNMNFKKNSKILKKDKISRNVDKIKFEKIQKDTDIEYEIRSKCLKESIILKEKPETNIIDFVIQTDLSLQLNDDNSIDLFDNKKKVFKIEKPYMIDKNKAYSENIKYEILENNNYYELKIILDNDWINDKDRAFPVIIDPTVTGIEDTNSVEDTYIFNGDESTTTYNLNKLLVGTDENNVSYRTLLKFNLPVIPTGYRMVNAELYLYSIPEYGNKVLNDKKISIHRINQNWNESTAKWNNINSSFDNKIYDYSVSSNSIYYAENDEIKIDWGGTGANVTQLVQEWYNNPSNNYGMLLKWFDETYSSENEVCEFISSEYLEDSNINSLKPLLSITYKDFNGIESYLSYSTQNHHFGESHVNNYTGNLTVCFNVGTTIGGTLPISFSLVYNTNDVIANKDYGYGLGIKPNLVQTLEEEQMSVTSDEDENVIIYDMLKYLDEDGTIHYFYKNEDESYYDEDGLGLMIVKDNNNYLMTDQNGNTNKFVLHNDIYYLEEIKDISNKKIQINYDINNRIVSAIDSTNHSVAITYEENLMTISSPHLETTINLTDNLLTSITSTGGTENITYTESNLIEKIINPNGLAIKYEYLNTLTSKVSKVIELSRNNNVGNYLVFEYNLSDTKITDNKARYNTYIFNSHGNVVGITSIDKDNNLSKAYGQSYSFGNDESNINKLTLENSLIQYVNNLIEDSSFEGDESMRFINGDINSTNTTSSAYSKSGLKSLSVDIPRGGGYIYKDFSLKKGKSYTLSFFIKGASLTENVEELCVDVILSYDDKKETTHIKQLTNEFVRYFVTIEYTEDAIEELRLILQNVNAEPVSFFIDDIQLEEGEVANYYNLISNSNFENGTTDWNIDIAAETEGEEISGAEATAVLIDNNSALRLHSNPSDCIYISKVFNITGKAGDTFNLSFWYKNESIIPSGYIGLNAGIWANVFFHYGDDYLDGTGIPAEVLNVGSNNWQFLSKNFTAEADYENITLQILSASNANDCYLTNFTLFKDLEAYSYEYDENGNLISTTELNKEKHNLICNKNNQLIESNGLLGNNFVFEYDNSMSDRIIGVFSTSGVTSSLYYDDDGNIIKSKISNKKTLADLTSEVKYAIRAKGTNKYFYINWDKTIKIKEFECSYDNFYIIKNEENRIKLKHAILNNYFIKIHNNEVILQYGDNNNEFELLSNMNNSYSIAKIDNPVDQRKVLTISSNNNIILEEYVDGNYQQEFYFEQTEDRKSIESSFTYTDDRRFIKSIKDSLDKEIIYETNDINGLPTKVTDAKGNETIYTYNDNLQLSKIEQGTHNVTYEYDSNGNVSKINHGEKKYGFEYDEFNKNNHIKINNNTLLNKEFESNNGKLKKITYGNNQSISYEYDEFDREKRVIKEDNVYTNYYDNLDRIVKIASINDTYNYEYDFSQRISKYNYNDYIVKYDYRKDNIVSNKIQELGSYKYIYNYEYNDDLELSRIILLNDEFNYLYDNLGRVKEKNINNNYKIKYNYITKGNKTSTIVDIVDENGVTYAYNYDETENITEIYKNDILTNKYYYDEHSQLVKEENLEFNRVTIYLYDNSGNMQSKKIYEYRSDTLISEDTYLYENTNWKDQLTKFNNEIITYDNIGNPISIGNKTLTWMNGRELSTYNDGTNNITFNYDVNGIRISKKVNNVETKYYLEDELITFENRNGIMIYYIYDLDGDLLGFVYNNEKYYYRKNILGDITGILNSNYNEIVSYKYDSWGNLISLLDNSNIDLGRINPFRYRSYYYDEELDLYYLKSRYYNPKTGRFINADNRIGSQEKVLSYNKYQYAFNNPVNLVDDGGDWPKLPKLSKKLKKIIKVGVAAAVIVGSGVVAAVATSTVGVVAGAACVGAVVGGTIGSAVGAISAKVKGEDVGEGIVNGFFGGTIAGAVIGATGSLYGVKTGAVIGKAQKTGTKLHVFASNISGGGMSILSPLFKGIYLNRALSTAGLSGRKMPDVIGVLKNGKAFLIEVVSKSQTSADMYDKLNTIINSGNENCIPLVIDVTKNLFKSLFRR